MHCVIFILQTDVCGPEAEEMFSTGGQILSGSKGNPKDKSALSSADIGATFLPRELQACWLRAHPATDCSPSPNQSSSSSFLPLWLSGVVYPANTWAFWQHRQRRGCLVSCLGNPVIILAMLINLLMPIVSSGNVNSLWFFWLRVTTPLFCNEVFSKNHKGRLQLVSSLSITQTMNNMHLELYEPEMEHAVESHLSLGQY